LPLLEFLLFLYQADLVIRQLLQLCPAVILTQGEVLCNVPDFPGDFPQDFLASTQGAIEYSYAQKAPSVDIGIDGARRD